MKKNKNHVVTFRLPDVIVADLDKIADYYSKRNQTKFNRSDVLIQAVTQYIHNIKTDRKI